MPAHVVYNIVDAPAPMVVPAVAPVGAAERALEHYGAVIESGLASLRQHGNVPAPVKLASTIVNARLPSKISGKSSKLDEQTSGQESEGSAGSESDSGLENELDNLVSDFAKFVERKAKPNEPAPAGFRGETVLSHQGPVFLCGVCRGALVTSVPRLRSTMRFTFYWFCLNGCRACLLKFVGLCFAVFFMVRHAFARSSCSWLAVRLLARPVAGRWCTDSCGVALLSLCMQRASLVSPFCSGGPPCGLHFSSETVAFPTLPLASCAS
jgi:hypothetical protein